MIQTSLDYLFREEGRQSYGTTLSEADVARLAQFIAFLWQVHPFVEGNTRTVAVFSELYLGSLGFTVGNEPFQKQRALLPRRPGAGQLPQQRGRYLARAKTAGGILRESAARRRARP